MQTSPDAGHRAEGGYGDAQGHVAGVVTVKRPDLATRVVQAISHQGGSG